MKGNFQCLEKSETNTLRVTDFPRNLTKHISVEDYSNVKAILEKEMEQDVPRSLWLAGSGVGGGDKLRF